MIGKAIGTIIVIVLFLGILYSVGKNQQSTQQPSIQQQQSSQEEETQEKKHEKKHKKSQEESSQQQSSEQQGGQEESSQQQSSEQQGGQEESSQQQGGQEHTESETESQSTGEANIHRVDRPTNDGPFVHLKGIVENIGNKDAKNYALQITVNTQDGRYLAQRSFNLGDIAVGEKQEYDGVINLGFQPGPLDYDYHETFD